MSRVLRERIGIALLIVAVLAVGFWRGATQRDRPRDSRVPYHEAEAWMVDAVPGVGPKTRDAVADAVRRDALHELPEHLRERLPRWFSGLTADGAAP